MKPWLPQELDKLHGTKLFPARGFQIARRECLEQSVVDRRGEIAGGTQVAGKNKRTNKQPMDAMSPYG